MKQQSLMSTFTVLVALVGNILSSAADNMHNVVIAANPTEVAQPTPFQVIRYRDQDYPVNGRGYGSDDLEFFNSLNSSSFNRFDPGEDVKLLAPVFPCFDRPLLYDGQTFTSIKIGEGCLVVGEHHFSVSTGRMYVNYASYNLRLAERTLMLPVIGWNKKELRIQVPGTQMIYAENRQTNIPIKGAKGSVLVRKSEGDVNEYEAMVANPLGLVRPVPLPENEGTDAKRGAVRVGDQMDLALKRIAEIPPGTLAHPPEGSSWSSFWVYGDGLLAIEVDPETKVIRKLAYVLGPAGESPVFLPLNRIHLTDGEMFMPIPPPPGPKDSPTTGDKAPDQNP